MAGTRVPREREVCPRCEARFDARRALVAGGVWLRYNVFSGKDAWMRVRCPHCWHMFPARTFRLFGVLPPAAVRWLPLAAMALCIVLVVVLR